MPFDSLLSHALIDQISTAKAEPKWLNLKRHEGLNWFNQMKWPVWGPNLSDLSLAKIDFFLPPVAAEANRWEDVPQEIRQTFEDLGIPEAERLALAGVGAQYDSSMAYHKLREDLASKGVVFLNMDRAVEQYPDIVKEYFMTRCVPIHDHPFAALHAAVWSGGTFIYVPPGVEVEIPLQAYFRLNAKGGGQFEHTLIIADRFSKVHYIEGCSAPKYDRVALHAGCVEIFVKEGAVVRYSSIENWSKNTYNLNTKRAIVEQDARIEWINGNMGSGTTMLYPMSILRGKNSTSDYLGVAVAGEGQCQDTGHKLAVLAPNCRASVRSKSLVMGNGKAVYRGLVKVAAGALGAVVDVKCDTLMLSEGACSQTIPVFEVAEAEAEVIHEASVGRIGEEQISYLALRGLGRDQAQKILISGYVSEVATALPLEYAVEFVRLIELETDEFTG